MQNQKQKLGKIKIAQWKQSLFIIKKSRQIKQIAVIIMKQKMSKL